MVCVHPQGDVGEHQPPHLRAQDPSFCPGGAALQTARALSSFDVLPSRPACTSQGAKLQPPCSSSPLRRIYQGRFIDEDQSTETPRQGFHLQPRALSRAVTVNIHPAALDAAPSWGWAYFMVTGALCTHSPSVGELPRQPLNLAALEKAPGPAIASLPCSPHVFFLLAWGGRATGRVFPTPCHGVWEGTGLGSAA